MSEELNDDVVPVETEPLPTEETEPEITQEETETDITLEETDSEIIPEVVNAELVDFEITEVVEEAEWTEGETKDSTEAVKSVLQNKLPKVNSELVKIESKVDPGIDQALVDKAVQEITRIGSNHIKSMMIEVGEYLIKEFFDNDLELAKQKKGGKVKSLRQVIIQLVQSGEKDYRKSWMYDSINLVLESKALESVHSYGNLSNSCKVLLLRIKDEEQKIKLIEKAASEKLSVSKLRELIKQGKPQKQIEFVTFLKKVKSVQDTKKDDIFKEYNVIGLTKEEYDELKKTIQIQTDKYKNQKLTIAATLAKYSEIEKEIDRYSSMAEKNLKSQPTP